MSVADIPLRHPWRVIAAEQVDACDGVADALQFPVRLYSQQSSKAYTSKLAWWVDENVPREVRQEYTALMRRWDGTPAELFEIIVGVDA